MKFLDLKYPMKYDAFSFHSFSFSFLDIEKSHLSYTFKDRNIIILIESSDVVRGIKHLLFSLLEQERESEKQHFLYNKVFFDCEEDRETETFVIIERKKTENEKLSLILLLESSFFLVDLKIFSCLSSLIYNPISNRFNRIIVLVGN